MHLQEISTWKDPMRAKQDPPPSCNQHVVHVTPHKRKGGFNFVNIDLINKLEFYQEKIEDKARRE